MQHTFAKDNFFVSAVAVRTADAMSLDVGTYWL